MRIRRFTAATMPAALREVRTALGPEAVILETTEHDGQVVVTAGVDEEDAPGQAELTREFRALVGAVGPLLEQRRFDAAEELRTLHRALAAHGVDGTIAAALVRETAALLSPARPLDAALATVLAAPAPPHPGARVRLLVGPPGDGKTTTLVKLAAHARREGRRVALVGADVQRVGAAAELETFGRALGVPTVRVATPAELADAVAGFAAQDRVFVDTAGACAGDAEALAELRALRDAAGADAACTLVASASTAYPVASRICLAFGALAPESCILTKVDAAPAGPWLGLLWRQSWGISHLATGRRIPHDLEPATPDRLARCLLAA